MTETSAAATATQHARQIHGSGLASFDIDWWGTLTDPAFLANPYPELNRIRELAPLHYDPVTGLYFVLGFDLFQPMLKSPLLGRNTKYWANGWNSAERRERDPETYELFTEFQPQMINANPPEHRRMRGPYEKAFRPGSMARYFPMIEEKCAAVMKRLPVGEPFDFMDMFGNPLPHMISLELFDIPYDMGPQISEWIAALSWLGNIIITPEQKQLAKAAQRDFKAFLKIHLAERARDPGDGFIGIALAAAAAGAMDEEETLNNVAMLISGSRTSLTLLGNGLHALLEHPAEFRKLREDRELMKQAIEEMLRYEPGSSIIPRAAVADYMCGDTLIPAGSLALGLVGAVNRDPRHFPNPDVFDISRPIGTHLAFGGGPHICIGKALARMTGQVAFNALMDRFSTIELAGEPVWWTDRSDQRGLHALPLIVRP